MSERPKFESQEAVDAARELTRLREGVEEVADGFRTPSHAAARLRALLSPEAKCPTCGSTDPSLHPGIGVMGIADPCPDPFHLSPEADDETQR